MSASASRNQEELQTLIYALHEKLRKDFKQSPDTQAWWDAHVEDDALLKEYSSAMYELATKIWAPRNSTSEMHLSGLKCRLQWVIQKTKEHFVDYQDGTRLKMLDIGSCYNPFAIYDFLDILPLDLCPAEPFQQVVYQGDFLGIDCVKAPLPQGLITEDLPDGRRRVKGLSCNYYDLAVFSFFLEYLPSPYQRLESCRRAYHLLRPGGILFILRPDSKAVTPATMKFIKQLKVGLAYIGFQRTYCDKLEHLWGMGFVKLGDDQKLNYLASSRFIKDKNQISLSSLDDLHTLFRIPQDSKEISAVTSEVQLGEGDPTLFSELPGFISD